MDLGFNRLRDGNLRRGWQIAGRQKFRGEGWFGSCPENLGEPTSQLVERLAEFVFLRIRVGY